MRPRCHSLAWAVTVIGLAGSPVLGQSAGRSPAAATPQADARGLGPGARTPAPAAAAPTGRLTLTHALELVAAHNARLAAAARAVEAAEGRRAQSRLLPNPELELETEDIDGSGEGSGFEESVTTLRLDQPLELGGKRARRVRVGELETELTRWDQRSLGLDVHRNTATAFVEVLAGQERLHLVREAHRLAERLVETVSERVTAGKVSPLELTKARVTLASRRIDLQRAEHELQTARVALATNWGSDQATFETVAGELATVRDVPPLSGLLDRLGANPDLSRWDTVIAHRESSAALVRAERAPDVTVGAGVAHSEATDAETFLVSVSLPLPLFDRRQGEMQAAHAELEQVREERRAAETETRAALFAQHQALAAAHEEAVSLRDELLPGAQQAFDAAREAYTAGKLDYLDVLDAQQTLFEVQMQYVAALAAYHRAVADTARLTGQAVTE